MATIVLDTGPLGLVTQRPGKSEDVRTCLAWMASVTQAGNRIVVPEVADYEVRRELLRAGKAAGILRLDAFNTASPDRYLPLTTAAVRLAAELWAKVRRSGKPTAPDSALDGDVLLAAQAILLNEPDLIVATDNVKHLSRFVAAEEWKNIQP